MPLRSLVKSGCSTCLWYLYGRFIAFTVCFATCTQWTHDEEGLKMHLRLEPRYVFYFYFTLLKIFLQIDYTYNNDHHHHSTLQPQWQIQGGMFLFYFFVFYTNYIYINNNHFTGLTPTTYLICSIHIILEACLPS